MAATGITIPSPLDPLHPKPITGTTRRPTTLADFTPPPTRNSSAITTSSTLRRPLNIPATPPRDRSFDVSFDEYTSRPVRAGLPSRDSGVSIGSLVGHTLGENGHDCLESISSVLMEGKGGRNDSTLDLTMLDRRGRNESTLDLTKARNDSAQDLTMAAGRERERDVYPVGFSQRRSGSVRRGEEMHLDLPKSTPIPEESRSGAKSTGKLGTCFSTLSLRPSLSRSVASRNIPTVGSSGIPLEKTPKVGSAGVLAEKTPELRKPESKSMTDVKKAAGAVKKSTGATRSSRTCYFDPVGFRGGHKALPPTHGVYFPVPGRGGARVEKVTEKVMPERVPVAPERNAHPCDSKQRLKNSTNLALAASLVHTGVSPSAAAEQHNVNLREGTYGLSLKPYIHIPNSEFETDIDPKSVTPGKWFRETPMELEVLEEKLGRWRRSREYLMRRVSWRLGGVVWWRRRGEGEAGRFRSGDVGAGGGTLGRGVTI
ncbi:hypothetical protein BJ508DRAFT_326549 [Ascobolus immersus RN42]|uniref:Uncharacterized protein n=1 Tax=Ascobolus immersus RN42 TaxID=1160509 RepID=A0A3N4I7H4_ASCIM|nr:hypothetical protein BJ508DRAFT_326549 [Ascobolus immersus RN42]